MTSFPVTQAIEYIVQRIKRLRERFLIKTSWQEEAILRMELIDLNRALENYLSKKSEEERLLGGSLKDKKNQ